MATACWEPCGADLVDSLSEGQPQEACISTLLDAKIIGSLMATQGSATYRIDAGVAIELAILAAGTQRPLRILRPLRVMNGSDSLDPSARCESSERAMAGSRRICKRNTALRGGDEAGGVEESGRLLVLACWGGR